MPKYSKLFFLLSFVISGLASDARAGAISAVIVYGDSLSDNGNLYAASGNTQPPSPPYFDGRRSNGPVAVEELASKLGVPLVDFAWVGATTGVGNYGDAGTPTSLGGFNLPGMGTTFTLTQGLLAPYLDSGLFVIWGGANDFLAPSPADTTPQQIIDRAVTNLISMVTSLQNMGATNILVPGLPDLGLTPFFRSLGPLPALQASAITDAFNALLVSSLPNGVMYYDTASLVRAMAANPSAYGFTNVTDPCFNGVTVCANPEEYLFFDEFHPTTATHTAVGDALFSTAVPEPSTFALAAASLALVAFTRRRFTETRGEN